MNMIERLGMTRNGRTVKDTHTGVLLRRDKYGTEIRTPFAYAVVQPDSYAVVTSALPGFEYSQPSVTIRTIRVDLPFVDGDKIQTDDAQIRTVQSIQAEIYNDARHASAYVLTLTGGGKRVQSE